MIVEEKGKGRMIAQKINRLVVFVATICCLISGLIGIICIAVVNSRAQQIYNQNMLSLVPVYHVQTDFQIIRTDLRGMALEASTGTHSGTDYAGEIGKLSNDMKSQINLYSKRLSSDEEKSNFNVIVSDVDAYINTINAMESEITANQLTQAMETMSKNNTLATDLKNRIAKAFTLNADQAAQVNYTSTVIFFVSIGIVVAVAVACILVFIRIASRTANKISLPIRKMVDIAGAVADGKLDVNLDVNSTDETGILAEAFQKIILALNRMKADVDMLIRAALEGNLDVRADTSKQSGDFKAILDGVNQMLDTVKAPLDVAFPFIGNLAHGVSQQNINNIYKGDFAKLTDNLNEVHHSLSILFAESQKLDEAGKNGDLEVRGDASQLSGFYAAIIQGINDTFDSIKAPLDVASGFIQILAEGGYQDDIDNVYKGYYATLVDDLNHARQSLHALVGESIKLKDAGLKGDLTTRGDASQLKGSYADIIDGLNSMLDAVAAPINEANHVLKKVAVNDYTVQMNGQYQGSFSELKNSTNSVMNTLQEIQEVFLKVSEGDVSLYETYRAIGKRSEQDQILPAMVTMMQSIRDMILEANRLASAAVAGDLGQRGEEQKFQGGFRKVIEGFNQTIAAVDAPLGEESRVLQELAQGNLRVEMTGEYQGEYNRVKEVITQVVDTFNHVLGELNIAADQVSSGSKQVADASQSLSQGASEQASSVEELTSTVSEVAGQTKQNADDAMQASTHSAEAQMQANQGKTKMDEMLQSMREINESSTSISKIIKDIDDIAFQTNILALNAAVEAARAGQYGKGFAVVAEEVRNLAAKSAKSAKDTAALIEKAMIRTENGTKIANETAEMLSKILDGISRTTDIVKQIASASSAQATAIAQIDQGITQVSTVVQTNSATAEESAASSEELSGQAEALMQLVSRFQLKNG